MRLIYQSIKFWYINFYFATSFIVYYKHNLSPKYIFPVHTRSGSIQLSRGLCEFSQTFCPFWLCFVALISKDVSFHWGKEELSSGGSTAVSLNHSNSWMSVVLWHRRLNRRINRMHYIHSVFENLKQAANMWSAATESTKKPWSCIFTVTSRKQSGQLFLHISLLVFLRK